MPNSGDNDRPTPPGDDDRPAKEEDLHATEDSIRVDLDRLTTVEAAKSALDPADPEVDRLSDEAVELADVIGRKTRAERQLGQEIT
jgi:hypothetical protein